MTEEEIIRAFHAMWDNYPEQVRLIDRTFLVLAGNKAYLAAGGRTGIRCNTGNPELHRGCQAIASLNTREAKIKDSEHSGVTWHSYWIPVEGEENLYVHFTNGLNETIAKYRQEAERKQAE